MSDQPQSGDVAQPSPETPKTSAIDTRGEGQVWSAIGSLVAGPAVWGAIGWAVDGWLDTGRAFTAGGVIVGFITSIYIVYVKFGRD